MKIFIIWFMIFTFGFAQNYSANGFAGTNMGVAKLDSGKYTMISISGNAVGNSATDSTSFIPIPGVIIQAAEASELLAVDELIEVIPNEFKLNAPYPNPFNAHTNITFELDEESDVVMQIYDIRGRFVATLVNQRMNAGAYKIGWSGRDQHYEKVSSGLYLIRISNGKTIKTGKMMLLQ